MANTQSVIEIVFNSIDNASGTAKTIAEGLGDLNSAVGDVVAPFEALADKLAIAQAALIAIAGTIGALAYKEAVEFEASLVGLQKQMEDTEGTARSFAGVLEDLAVKYGTNANELVQSAADFKAAGFSLEDSTKLVKLSLDLMIAGEISAAAATDVLKNSLGGFGISADESVAAAQEIADTLNKIADISKGGFKELAQGFSDIAPIAKLTGYSFQEIAAILSVVIDAGNAGAESARGLSSAWLSISKPSKEAADAILELGGELNSQGTPLKSIKETIQAMIPTWNSYTQEQKLVTAGIIAGKEQAAKFVVAMDEMKTVVERVAIANATAGGSIEKEVTIRLASAEQQIKTTNESWRQFLRALGDEIKVNTTGVISGLGDIGLGFKKVIEGGGLDPLLNLLNPQLKGLEDLLRNVAANLPKAFADLDWSKLVQSLEDLGVSAQRALESLLGPIDLSTVDGLRQAIQNVLDTLAGIVKLTAGELGGEAFNAFLKGVSELAKGFREADPELQNWIGSLLSTAKTVGLVSGALEPLNTAFLGIIAFGPKLAAMGSGLGAFGAAMAGPQGIAVALGAATAAMITWLIPAEQLADYAWPDWLAGYEGATPGTAAADIAEGFTALANRIKAALPYLDDAGTAIDRLGDKLSTAKEQAEPGPYEKFGAAVDDAAQKAVDGVEALAESWVKQDAAAKAAKDGIDENVKSVDAASKSMIGWADSIQGLPPIKLPEGVSKIAGDFQVAGEAAGQYATAMEGVSTSYSQIGSGTVKATGAFAAVKDKTQEAKDTLDALTQSGKLSVDQLLELTKITNDFKVAMEEIASNERIKNIEFAVSLKTAQLETDMERVKATFASIDTTITSTGDLLGGLFGNLTSTDDPFKEMAIESQIALENKRRQEALDIQKKLAEAEIERIEAQTASLNRGDALITIEGDGLEPELEAFMWKILGKIRTRANAEFADYLLGLGVTP
jgi:TP901 family phage tail tape measure protein